MTDTEAQPVPESRRGDLVLLAVQVQVAVAVISVGVAVLALATGFGVPALRYYLVFGGVVAGGGAVLLACAYRPWWLNRWQWGAVLLAAVAGTAASLLVTRESGCCLFNFNVRSGYPFDFTGWSIGFDTVVSPAEAHAAARARPDQVTRWFDPIPLLADLVFWGYAGLILLFPIRFLLLRIRRSPA